MSRFISFLFALLLSLPALAENWVRLSEVREDGTAPGFELKSSCEAAGKACVKIDGMDFDSLKVVDVEVDDLEKPTWEPKSNLQECDKKKDCDDLRAAPDFCPVTHTSITAKSDDEKKWVAYCTRLLGHEKKIVQQLVEDATKKAAKAALKASEKTKEDAKKAAHTAIKNLSKKADLTTAEVKAAVIEILKILGD